MEDQGLLTKAGAQPSAPEQQTETPDVDRELMGQVEEAIATARGIIYNQEVFDSVVDQAMENPVDALANTTVAVMQKIGTRDPQVALSVGVLLIGDIADALQQVGLPEIGEQALAEALQAATFLWLQQNEKDLDPQKLQQQMSELQSLAGGVQ